MAMIAGTAYCTSSFRIRSVPSSKAADFISVISYIPLKIPLPARTYGAHARGCLTAGYASAGRG